MELFGGLGPMMVAEDPEGEAGEGVSETREVTISILLTPSIKSHQSGPKKS